MILPVLRGSSRALETWHGPILCGSLRAFAGYRTKIYVHGPLGGSSSARRIVDRQHGSKLGGILCFRMSRIHWDLLATISLAILGRSRAAGRWPSHLSDSSAVPGGTASEAARGIASHALHC